MNRSLIDKSSPVEDCKTYDVDNIFEIYIVPENLGHISSTYSVHHTHIYAYIYEHILHAMCIYVQICVHVHV